MIQKFTIGRKDAISSFAFLALFSGILLGMFFLWGDTVFAQAIPLPNEYGELPNPEGTTGTEMITSLVKSSVANLRFIIGAIAIVMIVISGIRLIMARGNEEEYTKQRQTMVFAIMGLFIIGLAGELSEIFKTESGGFIRDPNTGIQQSRIFNRAVEIVITFLKYIIGSVAVLAMVRSGSRLILMGGNEEEVTKDKKAVLGGVVGFVFIVLADPLVNRVFFKIDTSRYPGGQAVRPIIDAPEGVLQLAGATNLVVAFAAPLATLSLIAGGIMYILAAGDEEKISRAKRIMLWALLGLIVIYGAFGVVNTFIAGRFEGL